MSLSEVIKTALDQMTHIAKTETVVGEPIVAGKVTLIPVSRISIGFAAGGGGQEGKNGGGAGTGGGINIIPVAFIVITEDRVQVRPISRLQPDLEHILSLAPDLVRRVAKFMRKKDDREEKKADESQ